jgi:hypothetical protein
MKWKVLSTVLAILITLGLLAAGWVWLTLHWAYSDGERTGYIQKFSRKGWLCKSWEGEIALVTMPGAIPDKFEFTVRDKGVADKINAAAGKRVVLHYEQHKFIPTSCFGDTEYFVDNIREPSDMPVATPQNSTPAVSAPVTNAPALGLPTPSAQQGKLQQPR